MRIELVVSPNNMVIVDDNKYLACVVHVPRAENPLDERWFLVLVNIENGQQFHCKEYQQGVGTPPLTFEIHYWTEQIPRII